MPPKRKELVIEKKTVPVNNSELNGAISNRDAPFSILNVFIRHSISIFAVEKGGPNPVIAMNLSLKIKKLFALKRICSLFYLKLDIC